jgi:hypothetical protein
LSWTTFASRPLQNALAEYPKAASSAYHVKTVKTTILLLVRHAAHLVLFDIGLCRDKTILLNVPHLIDICVLGGYHVASLTVDTVDMFELKAAS